MPEGLATIYSSKKFVPKFPAVSEQVTSVGWKADVLHRAQNTKLIRNVKSAYAWPNKNIKSTMRVWHMVFDNSTGPRSSVTIRMPHYNNAVYRYEWAKHWIDLYQSPTQTFAPVPIPLVPPKLETTEYFLPSSELASLWLKSMNTHIDASPARDKILSTIGSDFKDADARAILGVRIRRMLGVLGNRLRYGHLHDNRLTDDAKFLPSFQYEVLDRLHIVPSESSLFFFLMERDMRKFISSGGLLGGSWGRLSLDNRSIFLAVTSIPESIDGEMSDLASISD